MRVTRQWTFAAAIGLAAGAVACGPGQPNTVGPATTNLTMQVRGGFKYVYSPTDHQLEIAFMKSTTGACTVTQLGVELTVRDGDIVVPANPPADKTFDPGGAVVTFEGSSSSVPLTANRGPLPGPPHQPGNTTSDDEWKDLKWVPSLAQFYPGNPLNPQWRTLVDGRVVLPQGTLVGHKPSDDQARQGIFEFRRESDGTTFRQAITDWTTYETRLPGDRIVITLQGARSGVNRIEIKPSGGRAVSLILMGKHELQTPPQLHVGDTITHYCAFYELMSPVPQMKERLLPVFIGDPLKPAGGALNPGAYCSGEFN